MIFNSKTAGNHWIRLHLARQEKYYPITYYFFCFHTDNNTGNDFYDATLNKEFFLQPQSVAREKLATNRSAYFYFCWKGGEVPLSILRQIA